jgi:type IV fimbrial biogenesis protein FimT
MLTRRLKPAGFTLIEVVVTMTVLALILAVVLPSAGTWLDNTRIRNAADSLQTGLQTARSEAIRRNESVSFWLVSLEKPNVLDNDCALSGTSGSWVVSVTSPAGGCANSPSNTTAPRLVTARPIGDSGGLVSINALQSDGSAGTTVTFNGFGRVTNSSDAIRQIDVGGPNSNIEYRKLRLEISSSGAVRMCDPQLPSSAEDPRKC